MSRSDADDDYEMNVAKIAAFERHMALIPPQSWVLMRTGWSRRSGAIYQSAGGWRHSLVRIAAIRFLVEQRDIIGFGTETVGTDSGQGAHSDPPYPALYSARSWALWAAMPYKS